MQPLGYYGLTATEKIDQELSDFDCEELWDLVLWLGWLTVHGEATNEMFSSETYIWLVNMTKQKHCSLLKWISDRIELKLMEIAK